MAFQSEPKSAVDWPALIAKVKCDEPNGRDELSRLFSGGIRFLLGRYLGSKQLRARDLETFELLVEAIKSRDLDEQAPLVKLVRAIVLRQIAVYGDQDAQEKNQPGGLSGAILARSVTPHRKTGRMVAVLTSMAPVEREALTRFYCHGHAQEAICQEMELSKREFLVLKARAKAGFEGTTLALPAMELM